MFISFNIHERLELYYIKRLKLDEPLFKQVNVYKCTFRCKIDFSHLFDVSLHCRSAFLNFNQLIIRYSILSRSNVNKVN